MKLLLICTTLIVSVFFISSCQQEIDGPVNNGVNGNDSIYISKEIDLDTSQATGSDTLSVYQFYYDANKRLVHISERGYANTTYNMNSTGNEFRFYSGNDTVPYKMVTLVYDASNSSTDADTSFLFYNSNGVIIEDSIVDYYNNALYSRQRVDFFPIGTNRCMTKATDFDINTGAVNTMDSICSAFTIVNNNLTNSIDSDYAGGVLSTISKAVDTYNTPIPLFNPTRRFTLPFPAYVWHIPYVQFIFFDPSLTVPDYELNQEIQIGGPTYNDFSTYRFEYNSLRYPTVIRFVNPTSSTTSYTYKTLYFYTN